MTGRRRSERTLAFSWLVALGLVLPGTAHEARVAVTVENGERCVASNGLPDHDTGRFPNAGNPNAISAQDVRLCVPARPVRSATKTTLRGSVGVALNGVQIRPGTADYYDAASPRGFSRDPRSGWNLEGMGAAERLGMDANAAHVDERGLYHYHGVSPALLRTAKGTQIGWAADGFEIHYVEGKRSSWRLRTGRRPSAPGGRYDGTYVEDWVYVAGSGDLDECNGGAWDGGFAYFATDTFPFFPRCAWGTPGDGFRPGGRAQDADETRGARPPGGAGGTHGTPQPGGARPGRGVPPPEALAACRGRSDGERCTFTGRRGESLSGACFTTPDRQRACRPTGSRRP
ncbi:MAG: YHYH protein [Myxococcota bacterium]